MNANELNNQNRKLYGQILAQAMSDSKFHAALLQNPAQALKDAGYTVDPSLSVKVLESNNDQFYVVIPPNPGPGVLSDEHLAAVAGGSSAGTGGSASTAGCPVSSAGSAGTAGTAG